MDCLTPTLLHWQAQGGMVALGGHRLFVAQAGQHGSVLLFIHGYPTSSYDWHPLWAPLATRYRLIAPDLLGMGFSDKPADHAYGIDNHADLLEALLDRLGVQQVHIVAHDLGVSVAQEMLARRQAHPLAPRILSLTLLNGGVCPEAYQPRMLQHLLSSPLGRWIAPRIPKQAFERTITRLFGAHTLPSPALLQDFWALVNHHNGRAISHKTGRFYIDRLAQRDRLVGPLLRRVVPVRLINGAADPNSGAHMAARYRALVPDADVVSLPGIGHWPQIEAPDQVLQALEEFLQKHDQAG